VTDAAAHFEYLAIDAGGRRVKGALSASDERAAFNRLKRDGLSPLKLKRVSAEAASRRAGRGLTEEALAELLFDLSSLLGAGADLKTALTVIAGRKTARPTAEAVRVLSEAITGGSSLDEAFARAFGGDLGFVGGLVAAGEASGDLTGALRKGAALIEARLEMRRKLVGAVAYPGFVAAMTLVSLLVIVLGVIPALAPLVESAGTARPPAIMGALIATSEFVRSQGFSLLGGLIGLCLGLAGTWRLGLLQAFLDRLMLEGPLGRTVSALVFGGFAGAAGELMSAGVPAVEAVRLASRGVRSRVAAERLETALMAIRRGERPSEALGAVRGFPASIEHLARVGEAAGALGAMLERGGRIERERAIKRIETITQWLGPILIVTLGAIIGTLMAGLLSGVSCLGESALS
jgi:type II secretory pathway component PulF